MRPASLLFTAVVDNLGWWQAAQQLSQELVKEKA
jgi:serine/threonine protein phosphatase PrpC